MSGFHNCRGCITEVRCAELGRCLESCTRVPSQPQMSSDTPRTDAEILDNGATIESRPFVRDYFARELERENNALRTKVDELEQRIAKQNDTIDRLNQCEADTQRLDSLNRSGFDVTESRGRWCVMDYINEKAHYGKTIREAIDATFGEEWASKDR